MSTAQETRFTANDLLAMPGEKGYELIDGQLRESIRSAEASWIGGNILVELANYVEEHRIGWIFGGGLGSQCFPNDPERVRRPNVSIFPYSRLRRVSSEHRYTRVIPQLVVEVISPTETAYELDDKVADWLSAGVDELWIVMPPARTVTIHTREQSTRIFRADEELLSIHGAPGFRCQVTQFFATDDESAVL